MHYDLPGEEPRKLTHEEYLFFKHEADVLYERANWIKEVLASEENIDAERRRGGLMTDYLDECLISTVNLMDIYNPTRPKVRIEDGYKFESGKVGIMVGEFKGKEK